jgi:hypothetical protein
MISRQESEQLLGNEDGNFLVRESNNPPGSYTLAIKYESSVYKFKSQHYLIKNSINLKVQ